MATFSSMLPSLARRTMATFSSPSSSSCASPPLTCSLTPSSSSSWWMRRRRSGFLSAHAAAKPGVVMRSMATAGAERMLRALERDANAFPSDPAKQGRYLKELVKTYPQAVVMRFESNNFAADEAAVKAYVEAMTKLGRLDRVSMADLYDVLMRSSAVSPQQQQQYRQQQQQQQYGGYPFQHNQYQHSDNGGGGGGHSHGRGMPGSHDGEPLVVRMVPTSTRERIVSFLLQLAVFVGALMLFAHFAGERLGGGLSGGPGKQPHLAGTHQTVKFDDVRGCDEPKEELAEIIDFLKNPTKFTRLGGELPKGVLLLGPPGTGKTLLARAVAGESGVPFFYCSGSEFEEMYVGVGARRVRELFAAARKAAPCLIFVDEIDAIGGTRKLKEQQSMRMTLNQLLVELDGFNQSSGIVVIGATNFPEMLDKALIRPGRFDKHVHVPLPDLRGRKSILDLYLSKIPTAADVSTNVLARGTPGCSGAELRNLVNSAAVRASMLGLSEVGHAELEYAKDKILMGPERKSAVMTEESRRLTAYHEGGHALVAIFTNGAYPIHKATIMPRGQALGMVHQLPEHDVVSNSKQQLLAQMDVCMGGRVAEELIFGDSQVTTGASSDISKATSIAKSMVLKYGMSPRVGPIEHDDSEIEKLSPQTKQIIDDEVRLIIEQSYARAKKLLESKQDSLHALAQALLKYETLDRDEILSVLEGKSIRRSF
eukprot:TRINITY_DN66132_c5_g4_i1.p1 TRINITY_DN66132_c5_g4~~TRINITY_DN66132_c5_g4_i1.p1  ORF type:complete len:751 (-),score=350.00 TRINITY_DN66132_c5_g4_i1:49-2178(-)